MTKKLKACPFCEEENCIELKHDGDVGHIGPTQVQCENCGAIGPTWEVVDLPEGKRKDAALVAAWNRD